MFSDTLISQSWSACLCHSKLVVVHLTQRRTKIDGKERRGVVTERGKAVRELISTMFYLKHIHNKLY